ncbi:MAG: 3-keto-5-aminohexanoate cleavage protein [Actinomycetota bacterium]
MFVPADKLLIEAAINEQATKSENPYVPITPEECAADALAAAEAGAAIVHFHARDPVTGALLAPGTECYAEVIRLINAERPDLLVYPTYGGAPNAADRFVHIATLADDPTVRLRAATIDPGATNFSFVDPVTGTIRGDHVFGVSHDHLAYFLELTAAKGIQYSVVVREPGHVRITVAAYRNGWMRGTVLFKLNLADHALWGLPPSADAVDAYLGIVPDDIPYTYMAYTYGPSHWEMSRLAIARGAHVRVGLGDNPVEADGTRHTNADLVRRIVDMAAAAGREPATPAEALTILGVPAR